MTSGGHLSAFYYHSGHFVAHLHWEWIDEDVMYAIVGHIVSLP